MALFRLVRALLLGRLVNINITTEELKVCWGEKFFMECFEEAKTIREQTRKTKDRQDLIPAALVLAVAIKKLKARP